MRGTGKASLFKISIALTVIFTASNIMIYPWDIDVGYYVLTALASFLVGVILADFENSLKLVLTSFIVGFIAIAFLNVLPLLLYGAPMDDINIGIALATTDLSRRAILSFPTGVFACIFGCFVGNALLDRETPFWTKSENSISSKTPQIEKQNVKN